MGQWWGWGCRCGRGTRVVSVREDCCMGVACGWGCVRVWLGCGSRYGEFPAGGGGGCGSA
eukprot:2519963-Prorocentrum_lima.AAC.1